MKFIMLDMRSQSSLKSSLTPHSVLIRRSSTMEQKVQLNFYLGNKRRFEDSTLKRFFFFFFLSFQGLLFSVVPSVCSHGDIRCRFGVQLLRPVALAHDSKVWMVNCCCLFCVPSLVIPSENDSGWFFALVWETSRIHCGSKLRVHELKSRL